MKKSERGFSMVEMLVTVGLLGGTTIIGMQLTRKNMQNDLRQMATKEIDSLILQIKGHLENPKSCMNTLGALSASGADFTLVKDSDALVMFQAGLEYNKVKIDEMKVIPAIPGTGTWSAPNDVGYIHVEATFSRTMKPPEILKTTKRFKLWVRTDGSNKIINCSGSTYVANNVWRRSYQDANNIFYQGGRVKIGAPGFSGIKTAETFLSVNGPINASNELYEPITLGGNGANFGIILGADKKIQFKNTSTARNADLSANSISLSGSLQLKPYSVTEACSAATVGTLRNSGGLNQWCGGIPIQWRNFVNE